MKQIICLAGQPWSSSPGRTQQLLSRLRDTQVLYFSPAAGQLDRSYLKKGKKVRPNITAYTLPSTGTHLFSEFHNPFLFVAKVGIKQVLANYNRQKSRFYR